MEPTHWIMRIANGKHFEGSKKYGTWGLDTDPRITFTKHFAKTAKPGDVLWFALNKKAGGKISAVATFTHCRLRETGPLISVDRTNEELGWTESGVWDMLVFFKDLIDIMKCGILVQPEKKGHHCPGNFQYAPTLCTENLPVIYPYIRRFVNAFAVPVVDEFASVLLLQGPI